MLLKIKGITNKIIKSGFLTIKFFFRLKKIITKIKLTIIPTTLKIFVVIKFKINNKKENKK